MRTRLTIALVALTILASSVALAQPAAAIDLYKITGHVTDAVGRPLAGVTVRNGGQVTTTNATGDYSLGQASTGTFTLRASRGDLDTNTQTVTILLPLDTAVNFTMLYRITAATEHEFISTRTGPVTEDVMVSSWAPSPGQPGESGGKSCVQVTDSRTAQTAEAAHEGTNSGGEQLWRSTLALTDHQADYTYTITAAAHDCSSGTALTETVTDPYLVDNIEPDVDAAIPGAETNTLDFADAEPQPLIFRVADLGSGVDPDSAVVSLSRLPAGPTTTYSGAQLEFDATAGLLRTPAVNSQLQSGNDYQLGLTLSDYAGNPLTWSQPEPFRVVEANTADAVTTAEILPTACTKTGETDLLQNQKVRCSNLRLRLDATSVDVRGAIVGGLGAIHQTIDLTAVRFAVDLAGTPITGLGRGEGSALVTMGYDVTPAASSGDWVTYEVPQVNVTLASVTGWIPAGADNPRGYLAPTVTQALDSVCPDPLASSDGCNPDPAASIHGAQPLNYPASASPHYFECDGLATHVQPTVVTPGQAATLQVTWSGGLTATGSTMFYSVNGDPFTSVTPSSTTTASSSFTLPAAATASGNVIDYFFQVAGAFASPCPGQTTAIAPSNATYRTVAADVETFDETLLHELVGGSFQRAYYQPQLVTDAGPSSVTTICTAYFENPTPCELFLAESQTSELPATLPDVIAEVTPEELPGGGETFSGGSMSAESNSMQTLSTCQTWDAGQANFWGAHWAPAYDKGTGAHVQYSWSTYKPYGEVYQYLDADQFASGVARAEKWMGALHGFKFVSPSSSTTIYSYNVDVIYGFGAQHHSMAHDGAAPYSRYWVPEGNAEGKSERILSVAEYFNGTWNYKTWQTKTGARSGNEWGSHSTTNTESGWGHFYFPDRRLRHNDTVFWGILEFGKVRADVGWGTGGGGARGRQHVYNAPNGWRLRNSVQLRTASCGY